MKKLFLLSLTIVLLSNTFLYAQPGNQENENNNVDTLEKRNVFVRLFNDKDKIAGQGYLLIGSDSTIEIKHSRKIITFPVKEISFIKTKRGVGYSVLIGTAIGTVIGAVGILIAISEDKNETEQGFGPGKGLGLALASVAVIPVGPLAGGVAGHLKKRKTFPIQGDIDKWKKARKEILYIP